jgi:glycosyltransferase involved in cell wall biosynthesis
MSGLMTTGAATSRTMGAPNSAPLATAPVSSHVPRKPTICQLLHSMNVGGAEVLAARLARQLDDRYRFLFVCLDELGMLGRELRDEGFPVHILGRRAGFDYRCMVRLARLLRCEAVDLVQAHQYGPFFYGVSARLLCRRPAVLFTEHGRHFPDYPRRKRIIANRLLLRSRDRVVGVGEAVRRALIENEGIPESRVAVIYNGIDLSRFDAANSDRTHVRRELGLGNEDFVVLQVARLDYLKDHATAIRTMERVCRQKPSVRLVLIGDGPERDTIRILIARHGLEKHIRCLGLRTDVPRFLRAADAFLLTSISEGIPLTLIEAMAATLPVVSTDVGGVREVVANGQTGLLAPSGDDNALASAVLCLAGDLALCRDLGMRGRERAHRFFSEVQMHDRYDQLYQSMLAARTMP